MLFKSAFFFFFPAGSLINSLDSRFTWDVPHSSVDKNLPAMQETWVQFLGGQDLLEKEMATHSSILAWRIPLTGEPGRLQSMGSQELDTT